MLKGYRIAGTHGRFSKRSLLQRAPQPLYEDKTTPITPTQ